MLKFKTSKTLAIAMQAERFNEAFFTFFSDALQDNLPSKILLKSSHNEISALVSSYQQSCQQ
jgi:hypothetical protein